MNLSRRIKNSVLLIVVALGVLSGVQRADAGAFVPTGSLVTGRAGHTATLLADGRVLITGGSSDIEILASAEIYDPSTGTFTPTGTMNARRWGHTATLLLDGRVFISRSGGAGPTELLGIPEIYDPATGAFILVSGTPSRIRADHTATLLASGDVLIAGGSLSAGDSHPDDISSEIFQPGAGTFISAAVMARFLHAATLLADNRVLVVGGYSMVSGYELATAEIYDPSSNVWTLTGNLAVGPRSYHTVTLLENGQVFVAGGWRSNPCELFDPIAGAFSAAPPLNYPRLYHTATRLDDGKILFTGGMNADDYRRLRSAELYDPVNGTIELAARMTAGRAQHTATKLNDGRVLIVGGWSDNGTLATAELYDPNAVQPSGTPLTALGPATIWVGLKNSDAVGIRFDLRAEVYRNGTELVGLGELNSVPGGSSGFNNAKQHTINLTPLDGVTFLPGDSLNINLFVRNASTGSGKNSGTARLWYGDTAADGRFDAAIGSPATYHILDGFVLGGDPGATRRFVDVSAGAKGSPYKTLGSWSTTLP